MKKAKNVSTKKVFSIIAIAVTLAFLITAISLYSYDQRKDSEDRLAQLEEKLDQKKLQLKKIEEQELESDTENDEANVSEEEEVQGLEDESTPEETTPPVPQTDPKPAPTPTPPPAANWWDYPANISEIPLAQVSHTTIVDKGQKLPSNYAPTDLVLLSSMPGLRVTKTLYVRNIIVEPLRQLGAAAQAAGVDLSIISAYRSYQTQESTYQYWVDYNGGSVAAADQVSARPGHSEHQLGTVVDFSTSEISDTIGSSFHTTKAAAWLAQNGPSFGFKMSYPQGQESLTGYAYESWHWRYWGQ